MVPQSRDNNLTQGKADPFLEKRHHLVLARRRKNVSRRCEERVLFFFSSAYIQSLFTIHLHHTALQPSKNIASFSFLFVSFVVFFSPDRYLNPFAMARLKQIIQSQIFSDKSLPNQTTNQPEQPWEVVGAGGDHLRAEVEKLYWLGVRNEIENIIETLKRWREVDGSSPSSVTTSTARCLNGYEGFLNNVSQWSRESAEMYRESSLPRPLGVSYNRKGELGECGADREGFESRQRSGPS